MNNPLIFTDPSGYRPDLIFEEEEMMRRSGGGTGFNYFGWINKSMSSVGWTDYTGPTWSQMNYWYDNIKGNKAFGQHSENIGYWWRNGMPTSPTGKDLLDGANMFINDGFISGAPDFLFVDRYGNSREFKTKLSDLIQQYHDLVLTASTVSMPFPAKEVSVWRKGVAKYLRNTLFIAPGLINPFFRAHAIMSDVGLTFMGEFDGGVVFVLAGKDQGVLATYHEVGVGISLGGSLGLEFSRIDYSGGGKHFEINMLQGERNRWFISGGIGGLNVGFGLSLSKPIGGGERVIISGIQGSLGQSLFGGFLDAGWNWGITDIHGH